MKWLSFGDGSARQHATFARLLRETAAVAATTSANGLLERLPGVHRVSGVAQAVELARQQRVDAVVAFNPHDLIAGAADAFGAAGLRVLGPSRAVARLEGSKVFAKSLMLARGIPTPAACVFHEAAAADEFLRRSWRDGERELVLKTDAMLHDPDLRSYVPGNLEQARERLRLLSARGLLARGLVIEDRVDGVELSVHALFDGDSYVLFPAVQDRKRLERTGPNTHGMAALAGAWDAGLADTIERTVLAPSLEAVASLQPNAPMFLYAGIMLTRQGPMVLEYNVRPGNPEWLALLELLGGSLAELLEASFARRLHELRPGFARGVAAATMCATARYPVEERCRVPLRLLAPLPDDCSMLGERCESSGAELWATGGRALALTARAATRRDLSRRLRAALDTVSFAGMIHGGVLHEVDDAAAEEQRWLSAS